MHPIDISVSIVITIAKQKIIIFFEPLNESLILEISTHCHAPTINTTAQAETGILSYPLVISEIMAIIAADNNPNPNSFELFTTFAGMENPQKTDITADEPPEK
jgi:hypothetical protein